MIKFGTTVLDGSMVLDPSTGEVSQLVGRTGHQLFVNRTLSAFIATVREVSAAFPFSIRRTPPRTSPVDLS